MKHAILWSLMLTLCFAALRAAPQDSNPPMPRYAGRNLIRPENYREWIFLSSGLGMNYNPSPDGHEVFTNVFVPQCNAAVEHSFAQFYPTLKQVAKKFGTYRDVAENVSPIASGDGLGTHRLRSTDMYGMIVKVTAASGQRESLISALLTGTGEMPGCLSYIVAKDFSDENAIWITEMWDSKASHDASLSLPSVKGAITKAKPMIAVFGTPVVTTPVGGHGLQSTQNH